MNSLLRIALGATAAGLVSGCAVYPVPVGYDPAYGGAPPVVAAPAPVYYGPAYVPAPSLSIYGSFGHGHRGHGHRGWRHRH